MSTSQTKLHRLQSCPGHFYVGHTPEGKQAFVSTDFSQFIAVLFNAEGKYLQTLVREISQETRLVMEQRFRSDAPEWTALHMEWDELDRWSEELGLVQEAITIQKFCLPEYELCIRDLPEVYQEATDAGELDEETIGQIEEWRKRNDYVLVWGQEYDVDKEGEVVST